MASQFIISITAAAQPEELLIAGKALISSN